MLLHDGSRAWHRDRRMSRALNGRVHCRHCRCRSFRCRSACSVGKWHTDRCPRCTRCLRLCQSCPNRWSWSHVEVRSQYYNVLPSIADHGSVCSASWPAKAIPTSTTKSNEPRSLSLLYNNSIKNIIWDKNIYFFCGWVAWQRSGLVTWTSTGKWGAGLWSWHKRGCRPCSRQD